MGTRILLADDSITIQKVVNLTFADEGIEVIAVSNGDVAERRLDEVKPDLVLADIFMPGKNGYELCEAIKQKPQFRNVPVVLLVGAFEPFDQTEARRVRADAHLTKPFESRTLVETVRRLIKSSGRITSPIASMPEVSEIHDKLQIESDANPASPLQNSPSATIDVSAITEQRESSPAPLSRTTEELASRTQPVEHEGFDFDVIESPARDSFRTIVADTHEGFDVDEDSFSAFNSDNQEMTLDFDHSEGFNPAPSQRTISFEQESSAEVRVDIDSYGEATGQSDRVVLETTKLQPPAASVAWQEMSDSPFGHRTAEFNARHDSAYDSSGATTESARSTMLAVDEPLGDVLLDETNSADSLLSGSRDVDIADLEVGEAGNSSSVSEIRADRETSETTEPSNRYRENADAHDSRFEPGTGSHRGNEDLNWTSPRAGVYSTAQLDSVVMPVAASEYLAENSFDRTDEHERATFASSAMWTEEEARFSPIDIEAIPVEESEAQASSSKPETGFAFAPQRTEAQAGVASQSASDASRVAGYADRQPSARAGMTPVSELSPSAIEEIVRRVIAEMSDSVVREVAWEVVPDCVERVIGQLTRESMSRRA